MELIDDGRGVQRIKFGGKRESRGSINHDKPVLSVDVEDVRSDGKERSFHCGICYCFGVGFGAAILLAWVTTLSYLFDVICHPVPVIELFREFHGFCLSSVRLV